MKGHAYVRSGATTYKGVFDPVVWLEVTVGDRTAEMNMSPATARRIGLDLIASASHAMVDAGLRRFAQRTGTDGDGLVEAIAVVVDETYEAEK